MSGTEMEVARHKEARVTARSGLVEFFVEGRGGEEERTWMEEEGGGEAGGAGSGVEGRAGGWCR